MISPQQQGIVTSIKDKLNNQKQTIYENANPSMEILTARAKSSVRDSTYFTIEKIREKEGLTDIAVAARRRSPIGSPDRLYAIHIDNGLVRTMHREYPDRDRAGWLNDFDVEQGKAVAIAFDGRWHMSYRKTWGLVTDELPWLFWVDSNNVLKARLWDDDVTLELATDVVNVDAVRGWVPAQAGHTDDQGVIVAYVKTDGKVYYRNYCIQPYQDDLVIWEIERELPMLGGNNDSVRLFRTNDYRVGIIGDKKATGENIMIVTARNWSGMGVETEKVVAQVGVELDFSPILETKVLCDEYVVANIDIENQFCRADLEPFSILSAERLSATEIMLTFNYDIEYINHSVLDLVTVTAVGDVVDITECVIDSNDSKSIILTTSEVDKPLDIDIMYDSSNAYNFDKVSVRIDDYCRLYLEDFSITAEGELPEGYMTEHVTASVGVDMDLLEVQRSQGYMTEHVTASVGVELGFYRVEDAPV